MNVSARGGLWLLVTIWTSTGCVAELSYDDALVEQAEGYAQAAGLSVLTTRNAMGRAETAAPVPIDQTTNNAFFRDFGTNRRTCGTCHVDRLSWTITPEFARSRRANDPLFVFDGSDCLPPGVPNPAPAENSTQMLEFANVRVDLPIPANAEFTLAGYTDPLNCPTPPSAANLRMYRRPLPSSNTAFLATLMWDGRENVTETMAGNLLHQSNEATIGHAQSASPLGDADRASIVAFETGTVFAQRFLRQLDLTSLNARGGAQFLFNDELPGFFIGINDPFLPGFTNFVFDIYREWEPDRLAANLGGVTARQASRDPRAPIGRGEVVFNTKPVVITNVPGLNGSNDASQAPIAGFCGTCHDTPNVGNHSVSLPLEIGIASPTPVGGLNVVNLPTYTFQRNETGETITLTDGGRGLITGRWADLGKMKGPILRGLASRAPYFHNGSARDLATVVEFYDQRFTIGMTAQEKSDLVAFLNAL
jgi:cytochrome c peroxidase